MRTAGSSTAPHLQPRGATSGPTSGCRGGVVRASAGQAVSRPLLGGFLIGAPRPQRDLYVLAALGVLGMPPRRRSGTAATRSASGAGPGCGRVPGRQASTSPGSMVWPPAATRPASPRPAPRPAATGHRRSSRCRSCWRPAPATARKAMIRSGPHSLRAGVGGCSLGHLALCGPHSGRAVRRRGCPAARRRRGSAGPRQRR
jgi:hypothetical protein